MRDPVKAICAVVAALLPAAGNALAQAGYPEQTVRILVGPVAWVLAIVLALFSPPLGYAVYFAVLIGYLVNSVRDRTTIP